MRRVVVGVAGLGVALASCSLLPQSKPRLECSSPAATSTTLDLVRDQLQKEVSESLQAADNPVQVLSSKIRATIQSLTITLDDIRTAKQDPNSTKRFCVASLKVRYPTDLLDDAEKARAQAKVSDVSHLADSTDVERSADSFKSSFEYDVQPTDSGDKVFSETSDTAKLKGFHAELIASSLLRSALEAGRIQAEQQVAQQQQQQQAAATEQVSADHEQARTDNQLANQTLTAVWKNLDPSVREQLLDAQRAWIRKKVADCNVEAAGASTDTTIQDTARLRCDTKATTDRIAELRGGPVPGQ